VEKFSVNFVTFAFCKFFFCDESLENVAGIDVLKSFAYQLPNKEYLSNYSKFAHSAYYQLISEHFGKNCVILTANGCKMTVH